MYNFHTHTIHSDGCLLPSEIAVRYSAAGYRAIAITDHADYSNIEQVIRAVRDFTQHWPRRFPLQVLPGVELTHLPLEQFKPLAAYSRKNKLKIIVAHGQTPVEPVIPGTNLAALEADIDILAHPGRISDAEARLAARKRIFLEITTRRGHCLTNAWVARQALRWKAPMLVNHDSHRPEDIISLPQTLRVALKAGLNESQVEAMYREGGKRFLSRLRKQTF
jgi:histidinol phosphatase-like PHP family hydrolase